MESSIRTFVIRAGALSDPNHVFRFRAGLHRSVERDRAEAAAKAIAKAEAEGKRAESAEKAALAERAKSNETIEIPRTPAKPAVTKSGFTVSRPLKFFIWLAVTPVVGSGINQIWLSVLGFKDNGLSLIPIAGVGILLAMLVRKLP